MYTLREIAVFSSSSHTTICSNCGAPTIEPHDDNDCYLYIRKCAELEAIIDIDRSISLGEEFILEQNWYKNHYH